MTCRFGDLVGVIVIGVSLGLTVVKIKSCVLLSHMMRLMCSYYLVCQQSRIKRPMNHNEEQQLHTHLIEIVAARAMPFSSIEQVEVKGWFACFGLF